MTRIVPSNHPVPRSHPLLQSSISRAGVLACGLAMAGLAAVPLSLLPLRAAFGQTPGYGLNGVGGDNGSGGYGGFSAPGLGHGTQPVPEAKHENSVVPKGEEPDKPIPPPKLEVAPPDADAIAAVVNGDIITRGDVTNRARMFGLSTGLKLTPELLDRLRPQFTRELINDRLQLQEIQRRRIVVADADVAAAISNVEQRNGLKPGGLRAKLEAQGVAFSTLINQMRISLGWTRVLRQELAQRGFVTPAEIAEQEKLFKKQTGQPQYHVAEIFVPAEDPSRVNDARKFADVVIQQIRAGAPFGVVAAEFSQSETALKGGDLGWVRPDQLDPQIASLVTQMPMGAVSNPIKVAGGFEVVALQDKRLVGNDMATVLNVRQAFFPFTSSLDPQAPTEQQKQALLAAQALSKTATSCDAMEKANADQGGKRPSNPGELRLDHMTAPMQALLKPMVPGVPSKALVTPDGVMVVMVCSKQEKNLAAMTREDIADQLVQQRVELASRQLQQDLKRKALIDQRAS
jgi:peptidyl-prolyl cis-trans isomerase SurA